MEFNAYHFVGDTLRDGSPIPADGMTLKHDGPLEMCRTGLHASRKVWQALTYAPGHTLCRVHCAGEIINGNDKLVCSERTIIARIDASDLLWSYARSCALDVVHLWDAPDVVVTYLETGDEGLRDAARDAARAVAAWTAARDAAAWAAARDAAWDAAWAAARDAAWDAAAPDAQGKKQRARLTRMVNKAFDNA